MIGGDEAFPRRFWTHWEMVGVNAKFISPVNKERKIVGIVTLIFLVATTLLYLHMYLFINSSLMPFSGTQSREQPLDCINVSKCEDPSDAGTVQGVHKAQEPLQGGQVDTI